MHPTTLALGINIIDFQHLSRIFALRLSIACLQPEILTNISYNSVWKTINSPKYAHLFLEAI